MRDILEGSWHLWPSGAVCSGRMGLDKNTWASPLHLRKVSQILRYYQHWEAVCLCRRDATLLGFIFVVHKIERWDSMLSLR